MFTTMLFIVSFCVFIIKTNSIHLAANVNLPIPQKPSIFEKFRIPDETKMLPWQATLLLRIIRPKFLYKEEKAVIKSQSRENLYTVKILKNSYKWLERIFERFLSWGSSHQETFKLIGKASVFTLIGLAILRRLGNWYKGMAEYELLLDHTDYEYQAYGGCFNGIGSSLMASINNTAVVQYRYNHLMRRLKNSLDTPCFPQTMKDFSLETGRDVSQLLEDIDIRIREWRKKYYYKQQQELLMQQEQGSSQYDITRNVYKDVSIPIYDNHIDLNTPAADMTMGLKGGGRGTGLKRNTDRKTFIMSDGVSTHERRVELDGEYQLLKGLTCGVTVLQVRQADACLRIARLEVLAAVNTCEDLLAVWRYKVASKSQAFRLPLPRVLLGRFPGFGRGVSSNTLSGLKNMLGILKDPQSLIKRSKNQNKDMNYNETVIIPKISGNDSVGVDGLKRDLEDEYTGITRYISMYVYLFIHISICDHTYVCMYGYNIFIFKHM
jgi:hypothetical protein